MTVGLGDCFLTFGVMSYKSYSARFSSMLAKGNVAFTSTTIKGKKGGRIGKPIELLTKWEFRERFCILNGISIHLVDGNPTPKR